MTCREQGYLQSLPAHHNQGSVSCLLSIPVHQPLTTLLSAEIVRWVAESKRPFQIVNDCGFQSLMKTGRPGYHIPSAETVSCDVKGVFVRVRQRIAKMLQV